MVRVRWRERHFSGGRCHCVVAKSVASDDLTSRLHRLPGALSMPAQSTRRQFLGRAAALSAVSLLPASGWARVPGANGKLRIASIGCGGKGWSDLVATAESPHVDVVALCNIDESKD